MTIQSLLTNSHQAHFRAQQCRQKKDGIGHYQCLSEALELRLRADALDPAHRDPAWQTEVTKRFEHDRVMAFYRHQLGIDPDRALEPVQAVTEAADGTVIQPCVA